MTEISMQEIVDDRPTGFRAQFGEFWSYFSENRGAEAGGEAYLVKFQASSFYDEVARVVRAHMK